MQEHDIDLRHQTLASISQDSLQILAVGTCKDVEFLIISWPHGQIYRKKLGLEPKDFHVTLSKVDRHGISKDVTTIKGGFPAFVKMFQQLPETGNILSSSYEVGKLILQQLWTSFWLVLRLLHGSMIYPSNF